MMSGLSSALDDYLMLRHGLGSRLDNATRLLPRFVTWMDTTGAMTVTIQAAMEWATLPEVGPDSVVWSTRLSVVRGFARYLSGIDPATEIPPVGLLPQVNRWKPPYIYSGDEIAALLTAARRLSRWQTRDTYATLFGLLVVTGMRVGEALRLNIDDVDLAGGVLTIRESKFGKSRLVPILPDTTAALGAYAAKRGDYHPQPSNDSFFVSLTGTRLIYACVFQVFDRLRASTGIGAGAPRQPRIHDFRHCGACRVMGRVMVFALVNVFRVPVHTP